MAGSYHNENDPFAAAWLRELIKEGVIADGEVDERSIIDVRPEDLAGFHQHHFFAGIGGWPYALRLAGWPDDRPVWTASCPCQPLSSAGKHEGHADERHLWPVVHDLVAQCAPPTVFGEQVAIADGREWLAGIRADLEGLGYAVGAADLCAAGVGSPHIRQRLYWVANAQNGDGRRGGARSASRNWVGRNPGRRPAGGGATGRGMADTDGGLARHGNLQRSGQHGQQPENGVPADGLCEPGFARLEGLAGHGDEGHKSGRLGAITPRPASSASVALRCTDGKWRRVPADESGEPESALFPLAHGVPNRVGMLRGAGNAINPVLAARFIQAADEAMRGQP